MRASPWRPRALSLVEVTFSLGLLMTLLAGLFSTLGAAQQAEALTHERRAADLAASQILDSAAGSADFGDLRATWEGYAFHVPLQGGANLPPASVPINSGAEAARAGRVQVVEVDRDGDSIPDDYDGDGSADALEIRVSVVWRSRGGSTQRLELVTRRTR